MKERKKQNHRHHRWALPSHLEQHYVLNRIGNLLRASGYFSQASTYYRRAIRQAPKRGIYWSNLSAAQAGEEKWADAITAAKHALVVLETEKISHQKLSRQLRREIEEYRTKLRARNAPRSRKLTGRRTHPRAQPFR